MHWTYAIHRPFGDTAGHSFDQPFRANVSRERCRPSGTPSVWMSEVSVFLFVATYASRVPPGNQASSQSWIGSWTVTSRRWLVTA